VIRDLPPVLSVWPAVLIYPALVLLIFLHPDLYEYLIKKEGGIDFLTPILLFFGIACGFFALSLLSHFTVSNAWMKRWIIFIMLGMAFLAGEEVSWGQHYGLWSGEDLPAWVRAANDQNETNLHNLKYGGNSLEQGLKNIVYLVALFGCVLMPLVRTYRGKSFPVDSFKYWILPSSACVAPSLGVLVIMVPNRIAEVITGEKLSILRHSEMHEFYIALLMVVYLASIAYRLRQIPFLEIKSFGVKLKTN
jgi:hypothetical protein